VTCPHGLLDHAECRECEQANPIAAMARELRAVGWAETPSGNWMHDSGDRIRVIAPATAWRVAHELAQQREAGTVTQPVVGQEDET
jgi:hypothetical protein